MVEGASKARQTAGSMAALASGRHGKHQTPFMGHLPADSCAGVVARRFGYSRILVLIVVISAQEFLREIGKIKTPELKIPNHEPTRRASL
jgi:hypothetical protein